MEYGQIVMIGLALVGVSVCWIGLFWASLWAVSKVGDWLRSIRFAIHYEADEHETNY